MNQRLKTTITVNYPRDPRSNPLNVSLYIHYILKQISYKTLNLAKHLSFESHRAQLGAFKINRTIQMQYQILQAKTKVSWLPIK